MTYRSRLVRGARVLVCAVPLLGCASASSGTANVDPSACDAAQTYSEDRAGVSLLVLKDGRTYCEGYVSGVDANQGFELWSGTKSFSGVMAAAAVQDGLLTIDEPVSKTITEWQGDPAREAITIRQLLSLTSGIASARGRAPTYRASIQSEAAAEPGTRFIYGAAPFQIFGEVMSRKLEAAGLNEDPLAYLDRRVLSPIGVDWTSWRRSDEEDPLLPQGAAMTARQWARFGEFVRRGGVLEGKPLVDQQAFAEMFDGSVVNPAYGLSWWLSNPSPSTDIVTVNQDITKHSDELPDDLVVAAGAGNQRLYIIPSLGLTIVRQTDYIPRRSERVSNWSDTEFLKLLLPKLATAPNTASSDPTGDLPVPDAFSFLKGIIAISLKAKADGQIDYGRITGTVYDSLTADHVEEVFTGFGIENVQQEHFEAFEPVWTLRRIDVEALHGDEAVSLASAFTPYPGAVTSPEGITAELIEFDPSKDQVADDKFNGKVVLLHTKVEGIVFRHAAQQVASQFARTSRPAAILIAIHQKDIPDTRYAVPGGRRAQDLADVPWANISGADGEKLSRLLAQSDSPLEVRVTLDGELMPPKETQNVVAIIPGRTDEAVILLAHTDSHFQGATDNGSGVALLLALAAAFSSDEAPQLERTLVFVATGAHHNGPAGGVRTFVREHADIVQQAKLVINLEHVASRQPSPGGGVSDKVGQTNLFVPAQNPAIMKSIKSAAKRNGVKLGPDVRAYWSGDYAPFLNFGTPAVMLMQPTPWYHTEADTIDVISAEELNAIARTYRDLILEMDALPAEVIEEGTPTKDLLRDLIARRRAGR